MKNKQQECPINKKKNIKNKMKIRSNFRYGR